MRGLVPPASDFSTAKGSPLSAKTRTKLDTFPAMTSQPPHRGRVTSRRIDIEGHQPNLQPSGGCDRSDLKTVFRSCAAAQDHPHILGDCWHHILGCLVAGLRQRTEDDRATGLKVRARSTIVTFTIASTRAKRPFQAANLCSSFLRIHGHRVICDSNACPVRSANRKVRVVQRNPQFALVS